MVDSSLRINQINNLKIFISILMLLIKKQIMFIYERHLNNSIINKKSQQILRMKFAQSKGCSSSKKSLFNRDSLSLPKLKLKSDFMIRSIQKTQNGQSGAIFFELEQGSFVLKPSAETPSILFFNQLANILGVSTPSMDFITYMDKQYKQLSIKARIKVEQQGHTAFSKLGNKFTHVFYQIIQYVPSITLPECPPQIFRKYVLGQDWLKQIGCCIAYDLLINNNDRFHLVWGGQGNLDNILIRLHKNKQQGLYYPQKFQFIDHSGNFCNIDNPMIFQNISRHLKKVSVFYSQIFDLKQGVKNIEKCVYLQRLIKQIKLFTAHELTNQQIQVVCEAILKTTYKFMEIHKQGKILEILEYLYNEQRIQRMGQFCREQWIQNLASINLNYCQLYYQLMQQNLQRNSSDILSNH